MPTGQIVTRITSNRDLVGVMPIWHSVLKLKLDVMHIEVHHGKGPHSAVFCGGKLLAVVSYENVPVEQQSV